MKKLIKTIEKNEKEEIRIELSEYKGGDYLNIRIWADSEHCKERVPTPKGITTKLNMLPEIISSLQEAESEAREAGILE